MLSCLGAALAVSLAGCGSDPVPITPGPLGAASAEACQGFLDALPETLGRQDRDDVVPADVLGAAYGDPPIVVTCTDEAPADYDRFASCDEVNDVGWFIPRDLVADPLADAALSAMSHRPIVQVDVPVDYRPDGAAAVLAELAAPIKEQLELVDACL